MHISSLYAGFWLYHLTLADAVFTHFVVSAAAFLSWTVSYLNLCSVELPAGGTLAINIK